MTNDLSFNTIFFAGKPKGGKWSGVYVSPESQDTVRFGRLFAVISLGAPESFDSKLAGDLLIKNMQDTYYEGESEKNILSRIERACMSTAKRLEYLLEREKIAAEEGIDLSIEVFVTYKDFVYMAVLGEGSIMLLRDNALINLTEGLKDLSGRSLIRSGSGRYKEGDSFILLSPVATLNVNEHELKKSVKSSSLENIKEKKEDPSLSLLVLDISSAREDVSVLTGGDSDRKSKSKLPEEQKPALTEYEEIERMETSSKKNMPESDQEKEMGGIDKKETGEIDYTGRDSFKDLKQVREASKPKKLDKDTSKLKKLGSKVKDKLSDKTTYQVLWMKFIRFLRKAGKFFKVYIWDGFLGLGGGGLYLKGSNPKKSIRGIIILIVFAASLLFLSIRSIQSIREKGEKTDEVQQILSEIDEKFTNGRNLGEAGNMSEAVTILEGAMSELESAKEQGVLISEIEAKEAEGISILDEVRRVIILTDDNIITDIAGYMEGASADDMTLWQSKIYIVDGQSSSVYEVASDGGEVYKVVDGASVLKSPNSLVFDSNGNLLVNDTEQGILKVSVSDKTAEQIAGLSSTSVGDVVEIENYSVAESDFLYTLRPNDSDVRKIAKYPSGYSFPELKLFGEKLSGAKDIEIDGKIYILTQSEGVARYYVDKLDAYAIVGIDKDINDSSCLELDDLLVYVGDSKNKRIVIVTKGSSLTPSQGQYVAQFQYRGGNDYLNDIREIIVDGEARVIYILDGTKIFRAELEKIDEYAQKLI